MSSKNERLGTWDLLLFPVTALAGFFAAYWLVPGAMPSSDWFWLVYGFVSVISERLFARLIGAGASSIGFGVGMFLAIAGAKIAVLLTG